MIFGIAPLLAVNAGLLPKWASQLGALSSSLAAIVLAAVEGRRGGVRELLSRVLIWRVGIGWWAFALLFPIISSVAALYLFDLFGGPTVTWSDLQPLYSVVPIFIFLTIFAGLGEEFGWRGFALPRLQARYNALVSSLIVGVMWGLWHIPLFLTEGTAQNIWQKDVGLLSAILVFTLFVIVSSVQFTWVFNNTKGSVLVAAVMHGASNTWGGYIDVYRGHFGGVLTFGVVSLIVTILIVLLAGPKHLSRTNERNVLKLEDEELVRTAHPLGAK
jgi:hypothetical protein